MEVKPVPKVTEDKLVQPEYLQNALYQQFAL